MVERYNRTAVMGRQEWTWGGCKDAPRTGGYLIQRKRCQLFNTVIADLSGQEWVSCDGATRASRCQPDMVDICGQTLLSLAGVRVLWSREVDL